MDKAFLWIGPGGPIGCFLFPLKQCCGSGTFQPPGSLKSKTSTKISRKSYLIWQYSILRNLVSTLICIKITKKKNDIRSDSRRFRIWVKLSGSATLLNSLIDLIQPKLSYRGIKTIQLFSVLFKFLL